MAELNKLKSMNRQAMNDEMLLRSLRSSLRFNYYTRQDTAIEILTGKNTKKSCPFFLVSSLDGMNDEHEKKMHSQESATVFALCFSNSAHESIPMWYLYSGITGKGACIRITPLKMDGLLKDLMQGEYVFGASVENGEVKVEDKPLLLHKDYEIEYGWIYYVGNKEIIYRGDKHELETGDDLESFKSQNYFVKDHEWNYEQEFRIVFRLLKGRDRTKQPPEKLAVFFDKWKMVKGNGGLSLMLAPEGKDRDREAFSKAAEFPHNKVSLSKLQVSMNLVSRNRKSIVEQFGEVIHGLGQDQLTHIKRMIDDRLKEEKT